MPGFLTAAKATAWPSLGAAPPRPAPPPTFCSTAFSSEWTRICSFRRLAWKATASAWALLRTWAISSFALDKQGAG